MTVQTESITEFLLEFAREVIDLRAVKDGDEPGSYDAEHDPEGYVISTINALHHWCDAHGISWEEDLAKAQAFFEDDMEELKES